MKCCDYCGKENEDPLLYCIGCGSELFPPKPVSESVLTPTVPRVLNAKFGTIILLVFLAAQVVGAVFAVIFSVILTRASVQAILPYGLITAQIFSAIALVWTVHAFGFQTDETNPTGAAWVRGSWGNLAMGLAMGILINLIAYAFFMWIHPSQTHGPMGPLMRMSMRHGFARVAWIISALLLAPVFEEMLFRGVLYGGYRKSFGPVGAAALTTFIFVILHGEELRYQPLDTYWMVASALILLWMRLHSKAIGPAIAAHFGYNAVIVGVIVWFG